MEQAYNHTENALFSSREQLTASEADKAKLAAARDEWKERHDLLDRQGYSVARERDTLRNELATAKAERDALKLKWESNEPGRSGHYLRSVAYTAARVCDFGARSCSLAKFLEEWAEDRKVELARVTKENGDNDDFMAFMLDELSQFPCCHEIGEHRNTPPMMWPELIGCIAKKAALEATTRAESAEARCRVKDACLEKVREDYKHRTGISEVHRNTVLQEIHKALGTDGKVLTTQDSIAKRALADLATERARADKAEKERDEAQQRVEYWIKAGNNQATARIEDILKLKKERDEAARVADEAVRNIISIRCIDHIHIPQQNKNEITGAECGACIAAQRDAATIRADCAESACAAMRTAIGAKVGSNDLFTHLCAKWPMLEEYVPLRDYFRNLTTSAETTAGEALLKDKARLDWLEAHKEIIFCLSWNDFDKWTLCNNPTNSFGGANIIAEGPDLRRCLDAAAETQP